MAWPNSPLTAYIANSVPVIKADDLNAFQDWINALTNNTVTIAGLAMDAAGGAAATAEPNVIKWTNTAAGGNPARTTAVVNKSIPLNTCKAWLLYVTDGAGAFTEIDGENVLAVTYPAANRVRVQLASSLANTTYSVVPHCQVGAIALMPIVSRDAVNSFTLDFSQANYVGGAPVAIDPATQPAIEIKLHVFGRQDS